MLDYSFFISFYYCFLQLMGRHYFVIHSLRVLCKLILLMCTSIGFGQICQMWAPLFGRRRIWEALGVFFRVFWEFDFVTSQKWNIAEWNIALHTDWSYSLVNPHEYQYICVCLTLYSSRQLRLNHQSYNLWLSIWISNSLMTNHLIEMSTAAML